MRREGGEEDKEDSLFHRSLSKGRRERGLMSPRRGYVFIFSNVSQTLHSYLIAFVKVLDIWVCFYHTDVHRQVAWEIKSRFFIGSGDLYFVIHCCLKSL